MIFNYQDNQAKIKKTIVLHKKFKSKMFAIASCLFNIKILNKI